MLIRKTFRTVTIWMINDNKYPLFWISKHLSINLLDKIKLYQHMSQKYIINPFKINPYNKSIRSFYPREKYKYQIFSKHNNINYLFDKTTLMFERIYDNDDYDFDDSPYAKKFNENIYLNSINIRP